MPAPSPAPADVHGDWFRVAFCRDCDTDTRQVRVGAENSVKPLVTYWSCGRCKLRLITYADVTDAENLCFNYAEKWLDGAAVNVYGDVRSIERDELHAEMMGALWELYVTWVRTGSRGTFLGYASSLLIVRGAVEWVRGDRGRNHPKAHANAESLDAPEDPSDPDSPSRGDRLGSLATEGAGGVRHDCDSALRRAYSEGSRHAARTYRGLGKRRDEAPA